MPACVEQVSINTCPTDVFVEEVQVPVAQVAFLNLVVLFIFYNFYVCFNQNYIVVFGNDYLSGELVIISQKDIEYVSLAPLYILL